jgi:hypothetical protein
MSDGSKLGSCQDRINRLLSSSVDGVQLFRHERVLALAEIFLNGLSVKLASGHAKAMGKLLRRGEDRIWE